MVRVFQGAFLRLSCILFLSDNAPTAIWVTLLDLASTENIKNLNVVILLRGRRLTGKLFFEGWEEISREMVFMFKTVWDEIERQFSGLPKEDRFQVFSIVAPFITDMFCMAAREGAMEETVKPARKTKRKRRV